METKKFRVKSYEVIPTSPYKPVVDFIVESNWVELDCESIIFRNGTRVDTPVAVFNNYKVWFQEVEVE